MRIISLQIQLLIKILVFLGCFLIILMIMVFMKGEWFIGLSQKLSLIYLVLTASSSIMSKQQPSVPFGGIDFTDRAMRIGVEPMGSFADLKLVLPEISNVAAIDLDNEFKQIQTMASIRNPGPRIPGYWNLPRPAITGESLAQGWGDNLLSPAGPFLR